MNEAALSHLVILLLAVLIDQVWRWPSASHPLNGFRLLAEAMARKVKPNESDSVKQHSISGALAALLLIVPWVALVSFFLLIAEYPQAFEAVLMILLIDFGHIRRRYVAFSSALGKGNKLLAKQLLQPMVARDTLPLSDIGLGKAAVESLLLRFHYQYCATLLWFVVAGPVAALTYRLLLTLSWQWHTKRKGFRYFVRPVRKLVQLLNTPTVIISATLLALCSHPKLAWQALQTCPVRDRTSLLLAVFAAPMRILLGGPARYKSRMYRYTRVGGERELSFSDMAIAMMLIQRASLLLCTLLLLLLLMLWRFGG